MQSFYSPGKLLISAEYAVLLGAEALAIATQLGQLMTVKDHDKNELVWTSYDHLNSTWFNAIYQGPSFDILECSEQSQADKLRSILIKAKSLNPNWQPFSSHVETHLQFPRDWGLGSSSTLICNIAKWASVDAFELSDASFGGSGYDIAVGMVGSELLYSRPPAWDSFVWNPSFANQLYFVHLNRKQNSRESIRSLKPERCTNEIIERISAISRIMAQTASADEFQLLMNEHEQLLSSVLETPAVKERLFQDYPYAIKSLGGWGGDFIMAFGNDETPSYFKQKGFNTVIPFNEMKAT